MEYVTHHNVEGDELHLMHLGTTGYMLGSVLWILCFRFLPGTPEANMEAVWSVVKKCYKEDSSDTQYTNLTISSFCDPRSPNSNYPHLKGRGAEVKDVVKPLLACWVHFREHITDNYDNVRLMLKAQVTIQETLTDHAMDLFLPPEASQGLMECVDRVLHHYTILANKADADNIALWNITPKFHWLWHWSRKSILLNPRRSNCMLDEDYVGVIKTCVAASVSGTPMEAVPKKVMERILWGMHFLNLKD